MQAINIDEELLRALTVRGAPTSERERFARSLHPTGLVQVKHAHFSRPSFDAPHQQTLDIEFRDGAVAYDQFRYPVFGIFGNIKVVNNSVTIESLKGHNDSGTIRCTGNTTCDNKSVKSLFLSFEATAVPLEEELRLALPAGTRQLWDAMQPSGV